MFDGSRHFSQSCVSKLTRGEYIKSAVIQLGSGDTQLPRTSGTLTPNSALAEAHTRSTAKCQPFAVSLGPSKIIGLGSAIIHFFLRLGRWVSAEPAAVLAALLLLGFRRTLAAAEAARLLVTSRFRCRFGILLTLLLADLVSQDIRRRDII